MTSFEYFPAQEEQQLETLIQRLHQARVSVSEVADSFTPSVKMCTVWSLARR